jgi:SSS family transporter
LLAISFLDTLIIVVYVSAVVYLGVRLGAGEKNLAGYLLGGRDLPWWAVLGSIVATETSTATFLSVPGIAFAAGGDLRFLQLAIGFIVGRILVSIVLLPLYFRGELFTAYEVLDKRFGGATKQAASLLFLVTRNLGDGLRLFLTAIVLEKVAGVNLPICIVAIGVVTIVYTLIGGMRAVVWNDCIQFVVYIAGGVAAIFLIAGALDGGWGELSDFASAEGKLRLFDFSFDATITFTFWAGLIGGATLTLGTHGTDQMMVQRYLCTRGPREASLALVASGVVVFLQFALFLFVGVALACFYARVEPGVTFDRNDEVFATFIVDAMPTGLVGLTLAAAFAAAMSTLSSSLNSSAASAVNDLYKPLCKKDVEADQLIRASKWMTAFFGVVQMIVGIAASYVSRSVVGEALAIAGFSAGMLLGVFLLGVLTRRAGQVASVIGMVAGLVALLSVHVFTDVAWPWYAIIGASVTFTVGWLASLVTPPATNRWDDIEHAKD